jgi:hypothetical protein
VYDIAVRVGQYLDLDMPGRSMHFSMKISAGQTPCLLREHPIMLSSQNPGVNCSAGCPGRRRRSSP